ncbi:type II toxin-antitoxin system VapC family toxin [Nocardiopsis sp. FIRDI 009]|uniref:type II toxin-antitoxin system VapC family toxin n=1 Tax=Nocardiopsis sp. FIRDI 009 TaxID=714197 RepID=UPI000E23B6FD|nr:type II toxin-antitoxin system VapC family toxin [Nocardiopsis sp. FIRDI 009]
MVIIDASVLVNALAFDGATGERARALLEEEYAWAAPEHMPTEVFSAVRGLCLGGKISEERAGRILEDVAERMEVELVGVRRLFPLMWEMRGHATGYDAAYVAAARMLDCPLITGDIRLAEAAEKYCRTVAV